MPSIHAVSATTRVAQAESKGTPCMQTKHACFQHSETKSIADAAIAGRNHMPNASISTPHSLPLTAPPKIPPQGRRARGVLETIYQNKTSVMEIYSYMYSAAVLTDFEVTLVSASKAFGVSFKALTNQMCCEESITIYS